MASRFLLCGLLGMGLAGCGDRTPAELEGSAARRTSVSRSAAPAIRDLSDVRRTVLPRLSRSIADLPATPNARGGRRIELNGRMSSVHVVERQPDGKLRVDCVTSERDLEARIVRAEAAR